MVFIIINNIIYIKYYSIYIDTIVQQLIYNCLTIVIYKNLTLFGCTDSASLHYRNVSAIRQKGTF
jgi:hypothetical protein